MKAEDYLSPGMLHRNEDGEYDSSSQSLIREAECYLKQRQFWKSDADNYVSVVAPGSRRLAAAQTRSEAAFPDVGGLVRSP